MLVSKTGSFQHAIKWQEDEQTQPGAWINQYTAFDDFDDGGGDDNELTSSDLGSVTGTHL